MSYAQVTDGQIDRINVSERDARKGLVNFDGDYQAAGFWPITGEAPAYDPATQRISGPSYTADAGTQTVVRQWVVEAKALDEVKAERKAALAARRYEAECGGILFNGAPIATDDRSKTLLNGKYRTAEKNPAMLHRWKSEAGEVVLDSATVIAIGDAVSAHVQACFDHELDLIALIDAAADAAAVLVVDIETGWPT